MWLLSNYILKNNFCFADIVFAAADTSPCGDWEQYKDEHCYKLFDGLRSFSDSEKICQSNNSTLVSIHYAEEQNFLTSYIFTKKKVVENVWIGARYSGRGLYYWEDHTQLSGGYSNWGAGFPKNLTDHCVEMHAEEGSVGQWFEERCAKQNMVVCQRAPQISLKLLAETVLELKHNLQQVVSKMEKEISKLKNESIPIGFIYVQLPKDRPPTELWPDLTWQDISENYKGVFFRVVGENAASFGQVQLENAPRLETVQIGDAINVLKTAHGAPNNLTIPITGWSDGIFTGIYSASGTNYYINFKHTDIAEVRPKNMAIKVYKRTA